MSWSYSCPKCDGVLSPDRSVMLCGAKSGGQRVLMGFNPQPGNYEVHTPDGTEIEHGESWEFFCPVCGASLVAEDNENLCMLNLENDGKQQRVVFSRIAGERVTFVVSDRGVEEQHGKDADNYARQLMKINFIF